MEEATKNNLTDQQMSAAKLADDIDAAVNSYMKRDQFSWLVITGVLELKKLEWYAKSVEYIKFIRKKEHEAKQPSNQKPSYVG